MNIETRDERHFFQVEFFPGGLNADQIRVELYANALEGGGSAVEPMIVSIDAKSSATLTYSAQVSSSRPAADYTPRVIPQHPNASVPLEAQQILWQR